MDMQGCTSGHGTYIVPYRATVYHSVAWVHGHCTWTQMRRYFVVFGTAHPCDTPEAGLVLRVPTGRRSSLPRETTVSLSSAPVPANRIVISVLHEGS